MINWHAFFFLFFSILTCGFAFAVLFTSNIVRMAFYLTLCLGAASGLFFLAGAEFVGAMQFMIYVGGTLVLLIFGVMLTAQQRFISMETKASEWILAAVVGSALLLLLVNAGFSNDEWNVAASRDLATVSVADGKTSTPIGLALTGVRVDRLQETNPVLNKGMSGYLLPFVIVSMHLLVVLIGAGYMARTKRRAGPSIARSAITVRPVRKHSIWVMIGLIQGLVINIILAGICLSGVLRTITPPQEGLVADVIQAVQALPPWVLPTLGLLFLLNALLLAVVYSWQKWGLIALLVIPLIQGWVLASGGVPAFAVAIFVVLALGPALVLAALLMAGKPESAWLRMD